MQSPLCRAPCAEPPVQEAGGTRGAEPPVQKIEMFLEEKMGCSDSLIKFTNQSIEWPILNSLPLLP